MHINKTNIEKLPKELEYNCILSVDATIRFDNLKDDLNIELLIAKLYEGLKNNKKEYNQPERSPSCYLPGAIPLYILNSHRNFRIECSSKEIVLKQTNFSYTTWKVFNDEFKIISKIISPLLEKNIVLQLRYINVFDTSKFSDDFLDLINLDIRVASESLQDNKFKFQFEITDENYALNTTIANSGGYKKIEDAENLTVPAYIIDIITQQTEVPYIEKNILEALSKNHTIVKNMFFSLLKDKFKNTLEGIKW